jgi:predicted nucleotidyltransferase
MVIRSQTITKAPKRARFNVSRDDTLKEIVDCVVDIADPDTIILFGSRSIGKQRKGSDYDILVLKRGIKDKRKLAKKIYVALDVPAQIGRASCR